MSVIDKKTVISSGKREKNCLCLCQTVSHSACCRAAILLMTSHGSDMDFINALRNFFFRENLLRLLF